MSHALAQASSLSHFSSRSRGRWTLGVLALLCLLLSACGFHVRGAAQLPFKTIYTNISDNSAFGANLRRQLTASSPETRFVEKPQEAEAVLQQLDLSRTQREISINAQGQVEEYELQLNFTFQLNDAQGRVVLPPTTLSALREVPYDPNAVQAKESEISMIFRDMEQSLVNRIVRRLSSPDVSNAFRYAATQPVADSLEDMERLPASESRL